MPRLAVLTLLFLAGLPVWLVAGGPARAQDPCDVFAPLPGWPVNTRGAVSSLDVVDLLPGEPGPEVVVIEGERVNVFSRAGRILDVFFLPGIFSRVPSFADLDGDGAPEMVLGSVDGLHLYDPDADPRLTRLTDTPPALRPVVLADLDGDFGLGVGRPEIVEIENATGRIHVRDADGTERPGWPVTPFGPRRTVTGPPVVTDLDRDGVPEILVLLKEERTDDAPTVFAYAPDGGLLWSHRLADDYALYVSNSEDVLWFDDLAAGDVDGDGLGEVVVLHDGSNLRTVAGAHTWLVLDHRGRPQARWALPRDDARFGGARSHLALADLDGDGDLEVLHGGEQPTGTRAGLVFAWHHDGELVEGFPVVLASDPVGSVLVADASGDGRPDLLAAPGRADLAGTRLFAWDGAGRVLDCFPVALPRARATNALLTKPLPRLALGDLDGDGRLDVLARIGSGEIHGLSLAGRVGSLRSLRGGSWPTFRGDLARTGAAPTRSLAPAPGGPRAPVTPAVCEAAPGLCL